MTKHFTDRVLVCVALGVAFSGVGCGAAEPGDDPSGTNGPAPLQPLGTVPGGAAGAAATPAPGQTPGAAPAGTMMGSDGQPTGTVPIATPSAPPAPGTTPPGTTPATLPPGMPSGAAGAGGMMTPPAMPGAGGAGAMTPPTPPAPVNEVFVGENGLDTNPGTAALPFATINRAHQLARPGLTIFVLPGILRYSDTQALSVSGQQGNTAKLYAAPGARPVLEFAGQPRQDSAARGILLTGNFWHVRGLEIRNAGDNGMSLQGSNNVIENVIFHGNGDTGLQITVPETLATNNALGANNLILNCDSFDNFDPANNGENADGFAAKLRVGPGNIFRGCRAWNNADDGWDFFAADDVVRIENSWAFLNGFILGGGDISAGDGNGFKLGGEPGGVGEGHAPHVVQGGAAFGNRTCGYTINNNDETPVLNNCGIGANGDDDFCGLNCNGSFNVNITGAQAITRARNADGSLPSLQ